MRLALPSFTWPAWTRNKAGDNFYDVTTIGQWAGALSNKEMAQKHPILTPAILFVAKLFSQAELWEQNSKGDKKKRQSTLIKLLNNPNQYQTREDFLETLLFMMIAQGVAVVAKETIIGFDEPKALFVLDPDLIEWPNGYDEKKFRQASSSALTGKIKYDKDGENISYAIKDLMFFYDLPNMFERNPMKVKSRLDGLKQTLINTMDSLVAKNIILKSNGKELVSGKKDGFPLTPEEKKQVEEMFNNKTGLSFTRKRGIVTKADLDWKSLHIALRDLGLDESTKVDGNIIYTALHIPKDILSLEAKKTTYNNFKESMVSYVQNEMQSTLNSVVAVFNKHFPGESKVVGSFEHLPIMQFILLERYDVVVKQATALKQLLIVGVPKEVALEMCGFDPSLELGEMLMITDNSENNNTSDNGEQKEKDWVSTLRRIS